ncbi:MAG: type II toxin-antitoxin system RelE/ParE family toxin [Terracidiphilus sp.]
MAWTIEYAETARKQLRKLDRQVARRILDFMDQRISGGRTPRDTGKALTGSLLGAFWRYGIGDFRIICDIQDEKLCVLVVQIGNRREVYR